MSRIDNLISHSNAERMQRAADKRRRLLAFLRTEVWTTREVAAAVMQMQCKYSATKTLTALHKCGLVIVDKLALPLGGQINVVGITLDGQAAAAELLQKPFVATAYERGRVGLTEVPPINSAIGNLVKSVFDRENGLEEAVFRRTDHRVFETGGSRRADQGVVSATRVQ